MKRKTSQRNAIQEVFLKTDRPLGIDEILEAGRRTVSSLNQATVYRNLKLLVEKGWLEKMIICWNLIFIWQRVLKDGCRIL